MSEILDLGRRPPGPTGRKVLRIAESFAYIGGAIFVAIAVLSVASIVGRAIWSAPIQGDYELVQLGGAVFVSLTLPLCQMRRGNIIVDFFTVRARPATRARLDAAGALVLGLVMALLAWRIAVGTLDIREAGETTAILGWPIWSAYAAMFPGVALCAVAGFVTAIEYLREAYR
ncbi:MAG: TRAP transporter small permease [Burkholderiales bacterium]